MGRGMNAAIAVHKRYVYVGSRTDGKNNNANHAGVFIVDAQDPAHPFITKEMGPPYEGLPRESSRELRVWRSQNVLIVLHTNCGGNGAHQCPSEPHVVHASTTSPARTPLNPQLLYQNTRDTHEFYIWEDPKNPKRALLFAASAGSRFQIYDISPVLKHVRCSTPAHVHGREHDTQAVCPVQPLLTSTASTASATPTARASTPSASPTTARRLYFALLTRGFGVADVSAFTDTDPATNTYRLITPAANRVSWPGPGAHSAVKLWNKDWVYVSDEVYGRAPAPATAAHGAGRASSTSPTRPTVVRSEFRVPENQPRSCTAFNPPRTSYSAHNPTLTRASRSAPGTRAASRRSTSPTRRSPTQLAEFMPDPLAMVAPRGPAAESDTTAGRTDKKVVMWSYPVIQDGLIYTVDLRNGLYILKYKGPYQQEVDNISFLEGNSNQGDALCYEPVPGQVPSTAPRNRHPGRRGRRGAGDARADARPGRRPSARSPPASRRTTRRRRRRT